MAVVMYCPNCKTSQEVTKKGFNKKNEQLFVCKVCKHRFTEAEGTLPPPAAKAKTAAPKGIAPKGTAPKGTTTSAPVTTKLKTTLIVNNAVIKTVEGDLTTDQAFNVLSGYFSEIAKEKVKVSQKDGVKTIAFQVYAGTKG